MLSDPSKRDVYDVYGREGLTAGFSLGTKLKSTEELRAEWEAFKAQQRRAREEALANHRGVYVCKVRQQRGTVGKLAAGKCRGREGVGGQPLCAATTSWRRRKGAIAGLKS